jgi:hypothetical protein
MRCRKDAAGSWQFPVGRWDVLRVKRLLVTGHRRVLSFGKHLCAIEVKLTTAPAPEDLTRLNRTADHIKADKRILVSQTTENITRSGNVSCNLPWLLAHLNRL